jgi:hypothetical protein
MNAVPTSISPSCASPPHSYASVSSNRRFVRGSKQALGKKQPVTEPLAFDPASKTTFITYDIGTLRMAGKSPADTTYAIGTLRMTGRAGAATYAIGTLSMSGMRKP